MYFIPFSEDHNSPVNNEDIWKPENEENLFNAVFLTIFDLWWIFPDPQVAPIDSLHQLLGML